jgi:hypothetical protein
MRLEPEAQGWSIFVDFERDFILLKLHALPLLPSSSIQFVLIKNRARLEHDSRGFYRVPVHLGLNAVEIFVFILGRMTRETYCLFISKM